MHFMYLKHNAYCSAVFGVLPFASEAPVLSESISQPDNECIQEVTVTLQQPIPDEMYYAFAMKSDSCGELGQSFSVNITTNEVTVTFPVDVGQSRFDTRQEVYLISWYTQDGVRGPCETVLMEQTGVLNGI